MRKVLGLSIIILLSAPMVYGRVVCFGELSLENPRAVDFTLRHTEFARRGFLLQHTDSWFSADKFDHLLGSAMLSGGGFLALKVTRNDLQQSFLSSIGVVVIIGATKELYDFYHPPQQSSWKDLTAGIIGAVLGVLITRAI